MAVFLGAISTCKNHVSVVQEESISIESDRRLEHAQDAQNSYRASPTLSVNLRRINY